MKEVIITDSKRKLITSETETSPVNVVEEGVSRLFPSSSEILFPAKPPNIPKTSLPKHRKCAKTHAKRNPKRKKSYLDHIVD